MSVDAAVISQVIELRRTGLTLQQIGERFGKADSFAFKIIKAHAPDLRRVARPKVVDPSKPKLVKLTRAEMTLLLGRLEIRCFMGDHSISYDADDPDASLAAHGAMRTHIESTAGHDRDVAHRPAVKKGARRKKGGS